MDKIQDIIYQPVLYPDSYTHFYVIVFKIHKNKFFIGRRHFYCRSKLIYFHYITELSKWNTMNLHTIIYLFIYKKKSIYRCHILLINPIDKDYYHSTLYILFYITIYEWNIYQIYSKSSWLKSDLSRAPHYWVVKDWQIWGNLIMGHMAVILCHE